MFVRTTANAQIMLMVYSISEESTQPVGLREHEVTNVSKCSRTKGVCALREVYIATFVLLSQLSVGVPYMTGVFIVFEGLHQSVSPFIERHHRWLQTRPLQGDTSAVVHLYLTFLTLLGSDEHYAVSGTRTIDCCSTVLQEVDTLNIVSTNRVDVTSHTVDDDQRATRVLRHRATKLHVPALIARRRARTGNHHTRHLALQSLQW